MARFTTLSSTTLSLPLAALLLSSCTKQETTNAPIRVLVTGESGPLPAAGAANRLLKEQSAFLRKHANDVVDWYPWGPEAFALAKKENKPILVSIGYASCPWSQKLQEHAFKDPEIGRFQNRYFVNVLVDREERPDINNAYLRYVFWKSRKSGWPLHVWLTPDGLPIYTGIYFNYEVSVEGMDEADRATLLKRAAEKSEIITIEFSASGKVLMKCKSGTDFVTVKPIFQQIVTSITGIKDTYTLK